MISFARFTAALALAGAIISTPAYAAAGEPMSVAVRMSDLNLDTPAGRATLTHRIGYAAGMVCGHPDERDLAASHLSKTCRSEALASAMPQVQIALANRKAGHQFAANTISVTAGAF